jgi:hypothetical protein
VFSVAVILVAAKLLAVLYRDTICVVRKETGLPVVGPHAMRVQHMLVRRTTVCLSVARTWHGCHYCSCYPCSIPQISSLYRAEMAVSGSHVELYRCIGLENQMCLRNFGVNKFVFIHCVWHQNHTLSSTFLRWPMSRWRRRHCVSLRLLTYSMVQSLSWEANWFCS